jgi:hypothetical protein
MSSSVAVLVSEASRGTFVKFTTAESIALSDASSDR